MPAFANYLIRSDVANKEFVVERGRGRKRLSTLSVHVDQLGQHSTTIRVGGSAVVVSEGHLFI
jgi:predicted PhzF superfamily epimerase YddE/YHI9